MSDNVPFVPVVNVQLCEAVNVINLRLCLWHSLWVGTQGRYVQTDTSKATCIHENIQRKKRNSDAVKALVMSLWKGKKRKRKLAQRCEALNELFCRRGFTKAVFGAREKIRVSGEWFLIASISSTRQLNTLLKNGGWDGVSWASAGLNLHYFSSRAFLCHIYFCSLYSG